MVLRRLAAVLLLVPAAPALLLFAVGIRLAGPGPVLYGQVRIGRRGRAFRMWKLRTMDVDAERRLAALLAADPAAAAEWEAFGRLADDPRIAGPFARWARRLSVDELPQLLNVVIGDMAFIGPRPMLPSQAAALGPRARAERERVLPGLTGLWQVSGRSETTLRQMLRFDLLYVRRRSVGLDLWVLLRTPAALVGGRGAY